MYKNNKGLLAIKLYKRLHLSLDFETPNMVYLKTA